MEASVKIILDAPEDCLQGESGHTEFVSKCENCGRLANMVYQRSGEYVVACSKACGEAA